MHVTVQLKVCRNVVKPTNIVKTASGFRKKCMQRITKLGMGLTNIRFS